TADRGHRPLVLVLERLRLLTRNPVSDRLAGVLPGLEGHRTELRQHLLGLRIRDRRDVTDDVDLRVSWKGEVWTDADPISALQLEPERLDERVPLEAGAPDQYVSLDLLARLQLDASG